MGKFKIVLKYKIGDRVSPLNTVREHKKGYIGKTFIIKDLDKHCILAEKFVKATKISRAFYKGKIESEIDGKLKVKI